MKVLGLTGGIASGKSTVLAMFAALGAATYDADRAVHLLLRSDPSAATAIHAAFPSLPATLPVDRKALGALVFADDDKLHTLESIIHPRLRSLERACISRARQHGATLTVCDIPLLFEIGAQNRYDAVASVECPGFMQRSRALSRPGMTPQKLERILTRQLSAHEKRRRADFVIHSGLGRAYSYRQVQEIVKEMRLG